MQFRSMILAAAATFAATVAQAATVDWRAGSGNTGQHFTTSTGEVVFAGDTGTLTLGLRAVQRSVGTITPTGNVYEAEVGPSGASIRAWWNFDIFAGLDSDTGTLAGLQSLTLEITTIGGSAPAAASFNLLDAALRAAIDCHVIGCVNGAPVNPDATVADLVAGNDGAASATADADRFLNASQNPTFAPWFTAFDFNRAGLYNFTLSAVDVQGNEVETAMTVNVGDYQVPEPAGLVLVALGLAGVAATRRRRG